MGAALPRSHAAGSSSGRLGGAGERRGAAGDDCAAVALCGRRGDSPAAVTAPQRCLSGHVGALEGEPKAAERERCQGRGLPAPNAVPGEQIRGHGLRNRRYGVVVPFSLQVHNRRLSWNVCALQRLFVAVPGRWRC